MSCADAPRGRLEDSKGGDAQFVRDVPHEAAWPAADMRRRLAQGEAGTYIGALLASRDSVITRWPDRLVTPLRVWVGDGGDQEGWNPHFPTVVRDAFEEWSATGIPVRFTYVRDSAGADVRVRFVPQFAQGIGSRTIWSRDSEWWLVGGDVDLAINHPMGGAVESGAAAAIALHEGGTCWGWTMWTMPRTSWPHGFARARSAMPTWRPCVCSTPFRPARRATERVQVAKQPRAVAHSPAQRHLAVPAHPSAQHAAPAPADRATPRRPPARHSPTARPAYLRDE